MIIMLLYWKTGCYQCRFLFRICITAFMFTIIIVLAVLVISSLHSVIIAPDNSSMISVNVTEFMKTDHNVTRTEIHIMP